MLTTYIALVMCQAMFGMHFIDIQQSRCLISITNKVILFSELLITFTSRNKNKGTESIANSAASLPCAQ